MQPDAVKALIEEGMPDARVEVTGDGRHFEAVVVSEAFAGKSLLEKHRMVMSTVNDKIERDELHALSIKAYTPEDWAARSGG